MGPSSFHQLRWAWISRFPGYVRYQRGGSLTKFEFERFGPEWVVVEFDEYTFTS